MGKCPLSYPNQLAETKASTTSRKPTDKGEETATLSEPRRADDRDQRPSEADHERTQQRLTKEITVMQPLTVNPWPQMRELNARVGNNGILRVSSNDCSVPSGLKRIAPARTPSIPYVHF